MDQSNASPNGAVRPPAVERSAGGEVTIAPRLPFPVVGIGASAGGLEAFIEFFKALPARPEMAFILVQHLPPERESLLAGILAQHCRLPVNQVEDAQAIEVNHVYVIRPGRTLTIDQGHLHLGEPVEKRGHWRPVDDFLRSLAETQRERAIGIIMSGTGSNGTLGSRAIKEAGGLCIAQEPDSAKFPEMPRSVIDAGQADFISRPAGMPDLLLGYCRHPYATGALAETAEQMPVRQVINEILSVLRGQLRLDFTGFKKPMVLRRIERRMGLNQIATITGYADLLKQTPREMSALADDLVIHVTGFFRDPAAWESLREKVIAPLVAERGNGSPIRAWVAACASGEEAYTLGMLLLEEMQAAGKKLDLKIFATDTAPRSLSHARAGVYPGGIESELSPERLERYFDHEGTVYRVKMELRSLVVFAPQNLLRDPPFSRLDICTCRNLLIYLEPGVQQRALSMIHFGLREGGALLLGSSESVTGTDDLFATLDQKHCIFRRIGPTRRGAYDFPGPQTLELSGDEELTGSSLSRDSIAHLAQRALVERFGPPAVVIDRQQRIVYYQGQTEKYLNQPQGEPTRDLNSLAREPGRAAVRSAVQKAMKENAPALVPGGVVETPAGRWRVEVAAAPLDSGPSPCYFLVVFLERPESRPAAGAGTPPVPADARVLEEELLSVRSELRRTIEDLQASNRRIRASNEEVTSMNEELQSTNEELETGAEELHSLNEELTTVNAQLLTKMGELEKTTNDLASLLSSTSIAVIFLDVQFRIRRYTPAVGDLMELIPADIGRPMNNLARKFTDASLAFDLPKVLATLAPREAEVVAESGKIYLRRALPYRTTDGRVDGVVITFVDIGARRQAENELQRSEQRNRLILDGIQEYAIFMLDPAGRIMTWTAGAERVLGYSPAEAIGQPLAMIYSPEDRAAGVPGHELARAAQAGKSSEDHWHLRKDGRRFWATGVLHCLREGAVTAGYVKVLRDNTNQKVAEESLREAKNTADKSNEIKDQFLANVSHELRTPLSAIMLWSRLLSEEEQPDPERLREGLDAIMRCAEEQNVLIEDLVDTARFSAGKLRLDLKPTDLSAILCTAVAAVRPSAGAKGIAIKETFSEDAGVAIADPHRLKQVVCNLLNNAVKFSPEGGCVTILAHRRDDNLEITIHDDGTGIDPEFLPRIFERFVQADGSTTRQSSGLGLGLAIAKQLIEMHRGTIAAHSEGLGRGSTFTVTLPLPQIDVEVADQGSNPPVEGNADLQGIRVLLVEDAAETRKAVSIMLRNAGAQVTVTDSAPAALEAYARSRPDVILSDLGLPGTDGCELIQIIRQIEQTANSPRIPALAFTAYTAKGNRDRAIRSGFQECLSKPIDTEKLKPWLLKLKTLG